MEGGQGTRPVSMERCLSLTNWRYPASVTLGAGFPMTIATGTHRILLRAQIAELEAGRFLRRFQSVLAAGVAGFVGWLGLHSQTLVHF
jgi:hypothetical protein